MRLKSSYLYKYLKKRLTHIYLHDIILLLVFLPIIKQNNKQNKIGEIKMSIKLKRKNSNLSQVELAEKIGVKQNTISQWENGLRKPDLCSLKKLSEALNCTIDELIEENE